MITQEEKVDQVRSVTLDCQWGTGERLPFHHFNQTSTHHHVEALLI